MLYKCYLRNKVVYVPTVGQRGAVYTTIEPVGVVSVGDTDALRRAFQEVIARKNNPVPAVKGKWPPPLLPRYAGVKTWSAFARGAMTWNIVEEDGSYQIIGNRMHSGGYWEEDPDQKVQFPPGTSVDQVIERMISIVQTAAKQ